MCKNTTAAELHKVKINPLTVTPIFEHRRENALFKLKLLKFKNKNIFLYMTLEPKTSHKDQFSESEIYASSESWINNISIDAWFVMIGQYL